jgi:phytoene dehydrogenase-like protein
LAERARHWNTDFAGHIPATVTAEEAIEARQNSIEHMFGLFKACATDPAHAIESFSDAQARDLFQRSALMGTRQVPTLSLWQRMGYVEFAKRSQDRRLREVPSAIRATWPALDVEMKHAEQANVPQFRAQLTLANHMVKLMQESGVEILAGTDTGDPWTIPGATLHEELELLVKAGLTPAEALRTATVLPVKYLGWDHTVGLIKRDYVADVVLLDADPLADIRNIEKIAGVAVRGRYLNRAEISKILNDAQVRERK